jgi:hypothetical protein
MEEAEAPFRKPARPVPRHLLQQFLDDDHRYRNAAMRGDHRLDDQARAGGQSGRTTVLDRDERPDDGIEQEQADHPNMTSTIRKAGAGTDRVDD